jgi:hypothetical protein
MKKIALLLLATVAAAASAQDTVSLATTTVAAQDTVRTERGIPVYGKTTPHPVIVPEDIPVKPVIKKDAAPRKSNTVTEQNTKAQAGASK